MAKYTNDTTLCDKMCQVGGFLQVLRFSPPIKLLKVALSTMTLTLYNKQPVLSQLFLFCYFF